ncbi:hypothetical protein JTB14_020160 [Gonioctena quinquepunctata]|nr:hypothetical protein JTB14_020160 [Gonioctena quinquepunctata]
MQRIYIYWDIRIAVLELDCNNVKPTVTEEWILRTQLAGSTIFVRLSALGPLEGGASAVAETVIDTKNVKKLWNIRDLACIYARHLVIMDCFRKGSSDVKEDVVSI